MQVYSKVMSRSHRIMVGPLLINRGRDMGRHRGEGQVTTEAEVGVMHLQAKDHQRLPRATRIWKRQKGSSPRAFRQSLALPTP